MPRLYLGRDTSPSDFYRLYSDEYTNLHREGIERLLAHLSPHLEGRVLDLGCGAGLATTWLMGNRPGLEPVGVDASPEMVARYRRDTGCPATVSSFTEELPRCDSVIASYSLHLAARSEMPLVWYRLAEAGARTVVVISPFKGNPSAPKGYYAVSETVSVPFGEKGKTAHGWVCSRLV